MFSVNDCEYNKESFLEEKKAAREERALEKKRENAAICIQAQIRGFISRQKYKKRVNTDLDTVLSEFKSNEEYPKFTFPIKVYEAASRYLTQFVPSENDDRERFDNLCRYINASIEYENPKYNYASLALNKELSLLWIKHIKNIANTCCKIIEIIKPENHTDSISLALYLHTLIVLTSPKTWGILHNKNMEKMLPAYQKICHNIQGDLIQKGFFKSMRTILLRGTSREEITLKPVSLKAIITLTTRPLIDGNFSQNLLSQFLSEILSVPALIWHIESYALDCIPLFQSINLLEKSLKITDDLSWYKNFATEVPGTKSLAFLGNLVQLFNDEEQETAERIAFPTFTSIAAILLEKIPDTVGTKGVFSQWHDLLGWYTPVPGAAQNQNVQLIRRQYHLLWGHKCIKILLGNCLKKLSENYERIEFQPPPQNTGSNLFRRALERSSTKGNLSKSGRPWRKLDSVEVLRIAKVCAMYHNALSTLSLLKLDILSGICYNNTVLYDLWLLITSLGQHCGLKEFYEMLKLDSSVTQPQLLMLMLFCECMTHYVTILDEYEMYTEQKPFLLNDYVALSYFLNNFLYKIIQDNILGTRTVTSSPLFISLHTLLLCLYRRDCRRQFAPANHWLIHEIRPSTFLSDLDKGKRHTQILLQKMPHIIPHDDRVKLFRKYVQNEKAVLGLTESACASPRSALITIHRDRIVEDGYRQLAALRAHALKGVIRVRFINQQGLHEAGIDQDGVFKEFLEETIKRVFDPALNLFKTTSDQRLYPSPISYVQDNHLQLFDFVGKMLGKAVYEGIVVDVPFASFFLSQLLGQTHQALYSCVDELPSLDNELYKSLTFIKHYKQDVSDLNLTFSVDQDVMGKIVTHELHPGGKARVVTDTNKINYIHYMAYFHMHTQIREQTAAFNRGFRSIVNPEWLSLFSAPELQRLISGDTVPLDLRDLRKHTQYYGGFHDSHRVIGWLWDVLARDFTEEERKLFLKFVTSCSKPPLLGFAHLEPPFSIRCVEVGDDEDTGDTIGSVIRGFFTIRKKDPLNRLPTSSTCFNLLKLPNYQKKTTLRDKLRYAVCSNTGFELS
ncbi:ubiquitin-protein ligase E3B isoform X2 [Condylostylus longicornis]|uniref:ubiquitin-protein ligase E3B isoform X2 n=1 Tax=Condylostylus longicornis TaxID=2530218 RepID=UPI00244E582A|nr:ubiquitin-protein ligase E3B isoform X2 [Condylostylus longicornis]